MARFTSNMSTTSGFFERNIGPKGVYKHAILARYSQVFGQAAGSKPRKAALLDWCAGAGRYEDGRPRSTSMGAWSIQAIMAALGAPLRRTAGEISARVGLRQAT